MQDVVVKASHEVSRGKDAFLPILKKKIKAVLGSESREQIAEIDRRLEELRQELLRLTNSKKNYEDIADKIHNLRKQRQDILGIQREMTGGRELRK